MNVYSWVSRVAWECNLNIGDESHQRLNTGRRPIANEVPWGKDEKNLERGLKSARNRIRGSDTWLAVHSRRILSKYVINYELLRWFVVLIVMCLGAFPCELNWVDVSTTGNDLSDLVCREFPFEEICPRILSWGWFILILVLIKLSGLLGDGLIQLTDS